MAFLLRGLALLIGLAWAVGVASLVVGTFGWFGQPQDPLAAVPLVIAGVPWVWAAGWLPDALGLPVLLLAPGVSVALLLGLARRIG